MPSLKYQFFNFTLKSPIAATRNGFLRTKSSNSVQVYQKIVQNRIASGKVIYKESESYKGYHLFLCQNLCIHVGIVISRTRNGKKMFIV